MAMIKREPVDHINHWMESAGAGTGGLAHAGLLASLLPSAHFKSIDNERISVSGNTEPDSEPSQKRLKLPLGIGGAQGNIKDEVARLSSEVATLKNLLVNRMKDEEEDEREEN